MSKEKILRYSSGVASRKLQRRTGKQYFGSAQTHPTSIPQDQTSIPIEQVECAANLPPTSGLNICQAIRGQEKLKYIFNLCGMCHRRVSRGAPVKNKNRSDGPSYFSIALEHQNCALALFRPEVLSLNCDTCDMKRRQC
jgi:hypothetical protein